MAPKEVEISLKLQLQEAERKGREEGRGEGRKEGMAHMFASLQAADAGESQSYLLRTHGHSDILYFETRVSIAMMGAAAENNRELLHFFLEAGADINFCDDNDRTALQLAVFSGDIELVNTLLRAGADPNLADDVFEAPLMRAVEQGNIALVNALLAAGAHASGNKDEPGKGYWAIDYFAEGDHVEMTQLLLAAGAYIGPYERYDVLWTPLMFAALYGKTKSAALLIKAGSDVNAQDKHGETVLMKAAKGRGEGALDIIRLLLESGADLNGKDEGGCTALMCAAEDGHCEAVRLLLSAGADVFSRAKAREKSYHTPARKAGNVFDVANSDAVKEIIKNEMHRRIAAALSVLHALPLEVRQKIVQLYVE